MMEKPTQKSRALFYIYEALFFVNIACSIGYALLNYGLMYHVEEKGQLVPANGFKYLYFKSAIRINSFLHLNSDRWIGSELTFALSVLCLAALFFLFARVVLGIQIQRAVLNSLSGVITLFAVPLCWILVVKMTWRWLSMWMSWPVMPHSALSPWFNPPTILVALEIILVGVFFVFARSRPHSAWVYGVIVVHCFFWAVPMWIRAVALRNLLPSFPFLLPVVFFVAFPLAVITWLLCVRQVGIDSRQPQSFPGSNRRGFALALSLVPLVLLSVLWLPSKGYSVSHPKDMNSVVIKLARSQCFGVCPAYTITIHGDGIVNYSGWHNVGILGEQTGTIQSSQLLTLLQHFDDLHFFSIDDRAFEMCHDTPEVSIFLLVDGKEKTVASDASCKGAREGPQIEFVRLAGKSTTPLNLIVGLAAMVDACNEMRNLP